jgi:hypothetical protein
MVWLVRELQLDQEKQVADLAARCFRCGESGTPKRLSVLSLVEFDADLGGWHEVSQGGPTELLCRQCSRVVHHLAVGAARAATRALGVEGEHNP